jgi:hypothetical protein
LAAHLRVFFDLQHESLFDESMHIDLWPKAAALREKKLSAVRERKVR